MQLVHLKLLGAVGDTIDRLLEMQLLVFKEPQVGYPEYPASRFDLTSSSHVAPV
jgi:hypothetical protein